MNISQKIRAERIDNDESQEKIAKKLGITRQQYQLYESGKRDFPMEKIKKICEHYQVSADYLLGLPKGLKWPR